MTRVELEIRPAASKDVDTVVDILSEAARWVRDKGFEQWPDPFPADVVAQAIARGELYLALDAGEPVGTVTLQWDDPLFWGEQ